MSENRSTILRASLELFAAKGYDAVGVQQIADAAGIKKPTLYHYFGNKRGVLETIFRENFSPFLTHLSEVAVFKGDLPLLLHQIVEFYFNFAHQQPVVYRMHLAMWFSHPENEASIVAAPLIREQHQLLEAVFLAAIEKHGNMRGKHKVYAATFLGIINTYIILALKQGLKLDRQVAQQAVQQFSHGIYS